MATSPQFDQTSQPHEIADGIVEAARLGATQLAHACTVATLCRGILELDRQRHELGALDVYAPKRMTGEDLAVAGMLHVRLVEAKARLQSVGEAAMIRIETLRSALSPASGAGWSESTYVREKFDPLHRVLLEFYQATISELEKRLRDLGVDV